MKFCIVSSHKWMKSFTSHQYRRYLMSSIQNGLGKSMTGWKGFPGEKIVKVSVLVERECGATKK
jgi:hypothetical protein